MTVESLEGRTLLSAALVKTINLPTLGSITSADAVTFNGAVYFTAFDGRKTGLWKADGTPGGTSLVKAFDSIWDSSTQSPDLTVVNGSLFFPARDGSRAGLWESNGTAAGTALVKSLKDGDGDGPSHLTGVNGTLFFGLGSGLWKSDGTAAGTVLVRNLPAPVSNLTPLNGALFFTVAQQASFPAGPGPLWKSDGTAAGTALVKDGLNSNLTKVNGTLFFDTGSAPPEAPWEYQPGPLWKTDGTPRGTAQVINLDAASPVSFDGKLFFTATTGASGTELWETDGTPAGTNQVADINPGPASSNPTDLTPVGKTLFFYADDGVHGAELWKTDGTRAGTRLVKDINPGPAGSWHIDGSWGGEARGRLLDVNGTLFLAADDGTHGAELWKSDGTAAGTVLVKDVNPNDSGGASSDPVPMASLNDRMFFAADDGTHGFQPWVSDGTAAGTRLLRDIDAHIARSDSVVAQGSAVKVREGQAFRGVVATFTDPVGPTDPGSYTAAITWGDGHTSAGTVTARGNGAFAVSGSNTYAEAGSYAVSVHVTATGGTSGTATGTATVTDAPLYLGRTFFRVKKGQPYRGLVASLTDVNTLAAAGDFTVSIAWGDGHTSAGTLTQTAPGKFSISGGNTYAAAGSFTAVVTVTDRGGRVVSANTLVAVDG